MYACCHLTTTAVTLWYERGQVFRIPLHLTGPRAGTCVCNVACISTDDVLTVAVHRLPVQLFVRITDPVFDHITMLSTSLWSRTVEPGGGWCPSLLRDSVDFQFELKVVFGFCC
jgi:hypothetical protein